MVNIKLDVEEKNSNSFITEDMIDKLIAYHTIDTAQLFLQTNEIQDI